ncbi:uncharacterized protein LOC112594691 [Melanaphis sacchari]|uniref:uncharacterized protein LOC112594691 n=1 Tax=Melanaphis sacchari TaxID=742174 RepID=UPI000DC154C7|nr:uncharacterized protein LOC112594691 [Melanaphis sacchari]XP_025195421.1 uncharacterized protein LOC112594691 [Melanaphis sacchari]
MRPDWSSTVLRVTFIVTLILNNACTSKKQKRQLFRENVLPYFGGKIPDSAFHADRLALNMLNKEGISIPDGILFEARPKESFHQSHRNDPELHNSVVKMIQMPDGRFVPSEGKYEAENEVESTYRILIPSNKNNYHLPKFRPVPETLQLSVHQVFGSGQLSLAPIVGQIGVPLYPILPSWNLHDAHRPYVNQFNHNINQIIDVQSDVNKIHLTGFVCDRSGKIYPDPKTQCQVFHLCHYNGFRETFVCPQGTRYDSSLHECRLWYLTPCLDMRRSY